MKKIYALLVIIISLSIYSEIVATNNQLVSKSMGYNLIDGRGVTTFLVTSSEDQCCDLSFLMMPGEYEDGTFTSVTLKVNGVTLPNPISFNTYGWQYANTTDNGVVLNKGDNTIQFISSRKDVPLIRNIEKYKTINNKMFSNSFEFYVNGENFDSTKESILNRVKTNNFAVSPELLYRNGYSLDQLYYNTFILPLYYDLIGNEKKRISFYAPSNTATVDFNIYLFYEITDSLSVSATCNDNRYLFYETIIDDPGVYYLLLEAKNNNERGGVTINVDGITYRNAFVSNTSINVLKSKDESNVHVVSQDSCYNIFTTDLRSSDVFHEADSYLYLKQTVNDQGKEIIIAYNDSNLVPTFFDWGRNARIRTILKDGNTYNVGLCSMYPYSYFIPDTCNIYHSFWCNARIPLEIDMENFKYQDIIESGNMDVGFNCVAWSGGDNQNKVFPHSSQYTLTWFDKFYNNEAVRNSFTGNYYQRSSNMPKYTRCDITSEDAIIDVWGYVSEKRDTTFTHASIKSNRYDSIPHGYSWESKLGWGFIRVFHPRESIKGNTFGRILASYKIADDSKNLSRNIYENISENDIKIKSLSLSSTEIEQLSNLSLRENSNSLEELFDIWNIESNKMSYISNPDFFRGLDIYKKIILKLYQIENPIIYLFNKHNTSTPLIELFISDIVNRSSPDINKLWEESFVNEDNTIMSAKSKINLFYRKILELETSNNSIIERESKRSVADDFSVTVINNTIQIEVEIEDVSIYGIEIVDLKTSFVRTLVSEKRVQAGLYEHIVDVSNGSYVVVYYLNGKINTRKVIIK